MLGAVETFHQLREKREQRGFLSLSEAQVLVHLRDLFEPLRIGLRTAPCNFPLRVEDPPLGKCSREAAA